MPINIPQNEISIVIMILGLFCVIAFGILVNAIKDVRIAYHESFYRSDENDDSEITKNAKS